MATVPRFKVTRVANVVVQVRVLGVVPPGGTLDRLAVKAQVAGVSVSASVRWRFSTGGGGTSCARTNSVIVMTMTKANATLKHCMRRHDPPSDPEQHTGQRAFWGGSGAARVGIALSSIPGGSAA